MTSKLWRAKGTCLPRSVTTNANRSSFTSGVLRIFPKPFPVPRLFRGDNPHITSQAGASAHGAIPADIQRVRRVRSKNPPRTARAATRARTRHHLREGTSCTALRPLLFEK